MNQPCFSRVICQCAEDNPFANLSAELPDVDRFFALFHFAGDPPLGDSFSQASCLTVCESAISQEDADLCALRQAQQCVWDNPGFGGDWRTPPTIQRPNGSAVQIFSNRAQSCTTTCPDGSPFTFTVAAGRILALSQAQADFLAYSYACRQAERTRICLDIDDTGACQDTFFETSIIATGDALSPVNNWSLVAGGMPPGLTFHGGDVAGLELLIDGIPVAAGDYSFTVLLQAPNGQSQTQTFTITVGFISTSPTLPVGSLGIAYSQTLQATGLTGPFAWTVTQGSLPAGLALDASTGAITGTPTSQETKAFSVQVEDANGHACVKAFSLSVTGLSPFAWWKMEEAGAADRVDSVAGLHLRATTGGPGSSVGSGPGKILLGAKETCTLGFDQVLLQKLLAPAAVNYSLGVEFSFWTRWDSIAANVSYSVDCIFDVGGLYNAELLLLWNDVGAPNNLRVQLYDSTAALKLQLDVPFVPTLGAYYFIQLFYDGSAHKIGIQINRGTESRSAASFALPGTADSIGELDIVAANNNGLAGTSAVSTDEFAVFLNKKLSAAEADFLYNSAAGRTYPF